jgi:hypothetical protein
MIYLDPEWEAQWFSGKAHPRLPSLDDKFGRDPSTRTSLRIQE